MIRAELEARIAQRTGVSKATVNQVIVAFLEACQDSLVDGEQVPLKGIGMLTLRVFEARAIKSGLDGKLHQLPRRVLPKLSPSPTLSKRMTEALRKRRGD